MVRGEGERGAADEPLRSIDEGPDGAPAMSPNAGDVADPIPDHLPDSIPDLVQSVVAAPIDSATRRQRVDIGRISPAPSSPALFSESNPSPASFLRIHTSPLDEVEDALCTWCTSKGEPLRSFRLHQISHWLSSSSRSTPASQEHRGPICPNRPSSTRTKTASSTTL